MRERLQLHSMCKHDLESGKTGSNRPVNFKEPSGVSAEGAGGADGAGETYKGLQVQQEWMFKKILRVFPSGRGVHAGLSVCELQEQ